MGTDRLDRPLTIGQMQGKFQPVLLPQVGGRASVGQWLQALPCGERVVKQQELGCCAPACLYGAHPPPLAIVLAHV